METWIADGPTQGWSEKSLVDRAANLRKFCWRLEHKEAIKARVPDAKRPRPRDEPELRSLRGLLAFDDLLIRLEKLDKEALMRLVEDSELSEAVRHQRMWLSRKVQKKLPSLLDLKGISYAHLRAIVTFAEAPSPSDVQELVARIQVGKLKARDILDRVSWRYAGTKCSIVLLEEGRLKSTVVQIVLRKYRDSKDPEADRDQQRRFFCGPECARD